MEGAEAAEGTEATVDAVVALHHGQHAHTTETPP